MFHNFNHFLYSCVLLPKINNAKLSFLLQILLQGHLILCPNFSCCQITPVKIAIQLVYFNLSKAVLHTVLISSIVIKHLIMLLDYILFLTRLYQCEMLNSLSIHKMLLIFVSNYLSLKLFLLNLSLLFFEPGFQFFYLVGQIFVGFLILVCVGINLVLGNVNKWLVR